MGKKQPTASLTNKWNHISIWCWNHSEPEEMEILNNTEKIKTPFYACKSHNATPPCANRLNLDDYQGLILQFLDMMAEDPFSDFSNRTFSYRGTRHKFSVKVLKYSDDDIRLGIKNTTILI